MDLLDGSFIVSFISFQVSSVKQAVVNDSCFLLFPPQPHYQQCLLPSTKPIYNYAEEIWNVFSVPFWMPVKKNKFNFEWIEPSQFYGEEFTEYNQIDENNCLVYYNSTVIQTANCSDSYNSICVYDASECFDNTTRIKLNTIPPTSLKLVKSVKNASQLFLAIEYEKHLKPLGQHPFKCFVDLNVTKARMLYNTDTYSFGSYQNVTVYGFSTLDSNITSNYWCEAFQSYDLKMISSNVVHSNPCDDSYTYRFTVTLSNKKPRNIISFVDVLQGSFCVESVTIQNNSNAIANKTATFFRNQTSSRANQIFCFSFRELLRNTANMPKMAQVCINLQSATAITDQLIDILNSSYTPLNSMIKLLEVSERYNSFSSLDVYLTALIFRKFSSSSVNASLATSIVHNIMEINRTTLKESQRFYNATSMLLYRFDKILANAEMINATDYVQIRHGSITSLIANIKDTTLGGVASYNHSGNISVVVLSKTTPIEELLKDPNLHSAILLPDMISGDKLHLSNENATLALTFYLKDSLFNVEDSSYIKQVSSIFGTTLKDYNGMLDNPIFVVFRSSGQENQTCAYWRLNKKNNESVNGHWVTEDVLYNYTNFVVCKYYRLAHFALLIFEEIYKTMDNSLIQILEDITIVNSALSLFGAIGIMLTAILFKSWRKNKGNLVLMNFVFAICLQVVSLHVSNYVNDQESDTMCAAVGAILHYSVLSEFCWMLVIAVLQYKRYVKVFAGQPEQLMTKACVTGWILPLLPVTALLIAQPQNYTKSLAGLCYPAQIALYLTVFVPVGAILIINVIIYVLIIFDIFSIRKRCVKKELIFQWLIVVLLFFMLGVTWAFAFLGYFLKSYVLMFIFSVTSALQGFVVFLFFIVFNKKTRNMYVRWFKRYLKRNEVSNSKNNTAEKY